MAWTGTKSYSLVSFFFVFKPITPSFFVCVRACVCVCVCVCARACVFACMCAHTAEEEPQCVDSEGPVVCWESLGLPDLDCDDKSGWLSGSSLAGELIQPAPQEV